MSSSLIEDAMKITSLSYTYDNDKDYYVIIYILNDYVKHTVNKSAWEIRQSGLSVADFVAQSLRMELNCEPEEYLFDNRRSKANTP